MSKLLLVLLVTLVPSALVYASSGTDDMDADSFVFHGVALPKARASLAPVRQGTVWSIDAKEGQVVTKDTLLISFDARVQRASLAVAEAAAARSGDVENAKYQLEMTEGRLGRLQAARRREPRSVSDMQLAEANGAVHEAKALLTSSVEAVISAKATVELERARLEELRLRAPFDGLVTRIHTRVGESLPPGTPTIEVVNLSTLVAEVHLPARMYGRLAVGDVLELDASTPVSRPIPGTLVWIDPVIDGATRSYRCVFEIDNTTRRLPAGFTVVPVF